MLHAPIDTVAIGLETLTRCLRSYVAREMESVHGDKWQQVANGSFRSSRDNLSDDTDEWDAHALLTIMWDNWNSVFRRKLGLFERSLVAELRAFRNRWAHQRRFDFDDTYRLLDSVQRLLSRTTPEVVGEISEMKFSLLRDEFGEAINRKATEDDDRVQRWAMAFVCLACTGVFVYLIPNTFPKAGGLQYLLAGSVAVAMCYLIFNRFRERPVVVGPRECRRCRRIIYGTSCPYCAPSTSTFDSNEFRIGELESDGDEHAAADDGSPHPGFSRPKTRTLHRDN